MAIWDLNPGSTPSIGGSKDSWGMDFFQQVNKKNAEIPD